LPGGLSRSCARHLSKSSRSFFGCAKRTCNCVRIRHRDRGEDTAEKDNQSVYRVNWYLIKVGPSSRNLLVSSSPGKRASGK